MWMRSNALPPARASHLTLGLRVRLLCVLQTARIAAPVFNRLINAPASACATTAGEAQIALKSVVRMTAICKAIARPMALALVIQVGAAMLATSLRALETAQKGAETMERATLQAGHVCARTGGPGPIAPR